MGQGQVSIGLVSQSYRKLHLDKRETRVVKALSRVNGRSGLNTNQMCGRTYLRPSGNSAFIQWLVMRWIHSF